MATMTQARYPCDLFWGPRHNVYTEPTRQGWRCKSVCEGLWLVGRAGHQGCASVTIADDWITWLTGNHLKVVLHYGTPLRVQAELKAGKRPEKCEPVMIGPGAGLRVIELIKRL